jgi:hypothetical protein
MSLLCKRLPAFCLAGKNFYPYSPFSTRVFDKCGKSMAFIAPAIKYLKVVIPAKAGIQKTLDAGSSPA